MQAENTLPHKSRVNDLKSSRSLWRRMLDLQPPSTPRQEDSYVAMHNNDWDVYATPTVKYNLTKISDFGLARLTHQDKDYYVVE